MGLKILEALGLVKKDQTQVVNLEERLGQAAPPTEGSAVQSFRESLKQAPPTEQPVVRKSNIEQAIEDGALKPIDRTRG